MSTTVTIPEGFQFVGASLLTTVFLLLGLNRTVSKYRTRAEVEYPQMYAEKEQVEKSRDALLFNCAQRAHQNTLEQMPLLYVVALISGLKYPIPTALLTAFWTISRISYTRGYLTGDPGKRGSLLYVSGQLGVLCMIIASTFITGSWVFSGVRAHLEL